MQLVYRLHKFKKDVSLSSEINQYKQISSLFLSRIYKTTIYFSLSFFIYNMLSRSIQRSSRLPILRLTRRFTTYHTGSEGATASTGAFGEKEKAVENQWARAHVGVTFY